MSRRNRLPIGISDYKTIILRAVVFVGDECVRNEELVLHEE